MQQLDRIELRIEQAIQRAAAGSCPPKLGEALRYAVFPGGGRVRPRLTLAVAEACGAADQVLAEGAAIAIELIHCASLVHDDMPCFDDAATRRGKPALHRVYGEPLALLVGDALISLAYEELARSGLESAQRMGRLIRVLGRGVGASHGIIGGQAWECEDALDLRQYHRAKTGALFEAAVEMGAVAAGADGTAWREVGRLLGEAYQLADDLADVAGDAAQLGKPTGQDAGNHAPNAAHSLGVVSAVGRLEDRIAAAAQALPACPGRRELAALVESVGHRLCPPGLKPLATKTVAAGEAA